MSEIIDIICNSLFEALYICLWFSFLGSIFYNAFIQPLKYRQFILYRSICKLRNIIHIDKNMYEQDDKEVTTQLFEIRNRLQDILCKLDKDELIDYSLSDNETNTIPPQTHITFPHFMIIPSTLCKEPTTCLISHVMSNMLGLDIGYCMTFDLLKKRFITYIENNNLVKNDILILNLNLKQLFGILNPPDNLTSSNNINYKLKLSECESYLRPHVKNIHK